MKNDLSIVIPVYNEEKNINELYKRLIKVLVRITKRYEIIFVNDGSIDNTAQKVKDLRKRDRNVRLVNFSRNFGHMSAVSAGLKYSSGRKVVIMDADLQDPPSIIPRMYAKSLSGYDVVYGVKRNRKESAVMTFLFSLFYRILDRLTALSMPLDAGTFSIIDRKVVDILVNLPERNKYFSGIRAWAGFRQTGVVYARAARYKGKPAKFSRLLKLALDGLFSFSFIPLRMASVLGFIFAIISFALILMVIIARLVFGFGIIGWASTMLTILLMSSVQLITLGIIGEYLARIYDEVKGRPEYIISDLDGFRLKK